MEEQITLKDLVFAVSPNGIAITPKTYFEENGYLLDTQITCLLSDDESKALLYVVEEMCDSTFMPIGEGFEPTEEDISKARQGLLDLGLSEEPKMKKYLQEE